MGEGVSDEAELVQGETHCQEEAAARFSFQPCSRSGDISTHTRTDAKSLQEVKRAIEAQHGNGMWLAKLSSFVETLKPRVENLQSLLISIAQQAKVRQIRDKQKLDKKEKP